MKSSRRALDEAIASLLDWNLAKTRDDAPPPEREVLRKKPMLSVDRAVDIFRCLHKVTGKGEPLKVGYMDFRNMILASLAVHPSMHTEDGDVPGLDAEKCSRIVKTIHNDLIAQDSKNKKNPRPRVEKRRQSVKMYACSQTPEVRERIRVVFDPSQSLGMVFRNTVVRTVKKGGQASLFGVEKGWRIAEVCGKKVVRGFRGSDRSIYHLLTRDKSIPLGVVFDCEPDTKEAAEEARIQGKGGAGEVTLVFEANDVGLSIVTNGGVVDKVTEPSEPHSLGVRPGWVIVKLGSEPIPEFKNPESIDDHVQTELCRIVSNEEPVKITFLLPHRLRPDIISEITMPARTRPTIQDSKNTGSDGKLLVHRRAESASTNGPKIERQATAPNTPRDFVMRARLAFGMKKETEEEKLFSLCEQWKSIIKEWPNNPRDGVFRARRLARRDGIPPSIRAEVWAGLLGNPLRITPRLYDMLLSTFKSSTSRRTSSKKKEPSPSASSLKDPSVEAASNGVPDPSGIMGLILRDINRTFSQLTYFQNGCLLHDQLSELLCVYSRYRPDLGYIQGMSFLAGHLLLYMEDVYMAFVALANLLNTPLFRALFKPKGLEEAFTGHYRLHKTLLQQNVPAVARHFNKEEIEPDMYMLEWVLTLFSRRLRLDTAGRVWDMYLTHGEIFVHKAAVGVVKCLEAKLLGAGFADCLKILKDEASSLDPSTLIAACDSVRIQRNDLILMRQEQMSEGSRGSFIGEQ